MVPYAAYLRIYEPLSAFMEPERSWWAAYAASLAQPGRTAAMTTEHAEALRRIAAMPPVVVPERESEHAYLRRADGITFVCPWQTRLRSWLAVSQLRATPDSAIADAFAPAQVEQAALEFARSAGPAASARIHILTVTWWIPPTWFVPFAATERTNRAGGDAKALLYVTTMSQARRRVGRAIAAVRGALRTLPDVRTESGIAPPRAPGSAEPTPGSAAPVTSADGTPLSKETAPTALAPAPPLTDSDGTTRHASCAGSGAASTGWLVHQALRVEAELAETSRWLAEFHPYSLVELDYGGLVYLLADEALRSDESAAEVAAAVDGLARREWEVAVAMYQRVLARWWPLRATQSANLACCVGQR